MKTTKKRSSHQNIKTSKQENELLLPIRTHLQDWHKTPYHDCNPLDESKICNFLTQIEDERSLTDLIPCLDETCPIDTQIFNAILDHLFSTFLNSNDESELIRLFKSGAIHRFNSENRLYWGNDGILHSPNLTKEMRQLALFLEHGSPKISQQHDWYELAKYAAIEGDIDTVKRCLSLGISFEHNGYRIPDLKLLNVALHSNQQALATFLINQLDNNHITPEEKLQLLSTASQHCESCIPNLLGMGPEISLSFHAQLERTNVKKTYSKLLTYASRTGNVDLAINLVELGTPVTKQHLNMASTNKHTPVHLVLSNSIAYRLKATMRNWILSQKGL